MFIRLITLFVFISFTVSVNAQTLQWASQFGGSGRQDGQAITVDNDGNVFTTGTFRDSGDFNPGPGVAMLSTSGGSNDSDVFVTKQDASGNFVWAHRFGTSANVLEIGRSIETDNDGNVYVGGYFQDGNADFDPGPDTLTLYASNEDGFLVKLDAAGNLLWAKDLGGSGNERIHGVAVDNSGNVYATGNFSGTVNLMDISGNTVSLTSAGGSDIFVCKYDASGNVLWIKRLGGPGYELGFSIALDPSGNMFIHGQFEETADFDPGSDVFSLTSDTSDDLYVCKLTAAGDFLWAKQFTSPGTGEEWGFSVAADGLGNVYAAGFFQGTCDFDPGAGTFNATTVGDRDIYVCKLDGDGDFEWAHTFGSADYDLAYCIASDPLGNVYIAGAFQNTIDFDPGANTVNLSSYGDRDIFILQLDASGNYVNVVHLGGSEYDGARGVTVDDAGNYYATGQFYGVADFDPSPDSLLFAAVSSDDAFVVKLGPDEPNAVLVNVSKTQVSIYPNPTNSNVVCEFEREYADITLVVRNIVGQEICARQYETSQRIELMLNIPSGIYFFEVTTANGNRDVFKIVMD